MGYGQTLSALADPTRRGIFESLSIRPRSVVEIAGNASVSRPAVSQHLRVLLHAGLVVSEHRGAQHVYSVRAEGLTELRAYLDGMWAHALTAFQKAAAQQKAVGHERRRGTASRRNQ